MTSIAVVVDGVRLMEMGDGNKTKASSLALSLEWGPRARDHSLPGRLLAAWLLHIPLASTFRRSSLDRSIDKVFHNYTTIISHHTG